jgi:hypothetical protein
MHRVDVLRAACSLGLGLASACAEHQAVAGESAHAPVRSPAAAGSHLALHDATELAGEWVQYWSRAGEVDTQRYVFTADGQFGWSDAVQRSDTAAERTATRKAGLFQLEQLGSVTNLVLSVNREQFAACSEPCAEAQRGPRVVEHASVLTERYELGECAENREAHLLDERYACVSIAGHAFWRKSLLSAAELAERLWPVP